MLALERIRRYVPCWKQQNRVQVDLAQLQRWYRTLDHLIINKDKVEVALYERLRTLFDFKPDLVMYDLTSTYFEGHGPAELAKHGHSRDGKPRKVQVVVGVVMVAGWPIAHHVWAGNTRDSTTVKQVITDLNKRFGFGHLVFVGDRGMVTKKNLEMLMSKDDHGFLVGMTRRRNPEAEKLIDLVDESKWINCAVGINSQEKKTDSPRTRVQEVKCDREGVRVFVVDSDERRAHEERQRSKAMKRVQERLEKVQTRVSKGQLKKPEKKRCSGGACFAKESRISLLRLGIKRREIEILRSSGEPATRKKVRREVFDSDRPDRHDSGGWGGVLQRVKRSGAWIPFAQGPAGNATHLASQSAPG